MLPAMARKPTIAIVGPGRLGSSLAMELARAGYRIDEIISRDQTTSRRRAAELARSVGSRAADLRRSHLNADVIWFCVADRTIASTAREFSEAVQWKGKIALHSSGALARDELDILRKKGASAASVHPLMTFVSGSRPSLRGVPFALEGDAAALRVVRSIVHRLGGEPFNIHKKDKPAYHAWGAFTSPLLVALLVTAEQVARRAGLTTADARRKMLPIVRQTVENYSRLGPAGAFSGPLVRGDAEIVRKHLQVLKSTPQAREVYLALARSALRFLPVGQRNKLRRMLRS